MAKRWLWHGDVYRRMGMSNTPVGPVYTYVMYLADVRGQPRAYAVVLRSSKDDLIAIGATNVEGPSVGEIITPELYEGWEKVDE